MNYSVPKPPSLGMWLTFAASGAFVAASLFGSSIYTAAECVIFFSGAVSVGVILRWLVGTLRIAGTEFAAGYRESRATGRMPVIPRDGDA